MKIVVQRVKKAFVTIEETEVGRIEKGLLILLGIGRNDGIKEVNYLAEKVSGLRIFDDNSGKMNHSILDIKGEALVVSQFTLFGDCRKGRRPSYTAAANPEAAKKYYLEFIEALKFRGIPTQTGQFQAMMNVSLVNDGPVTLVLETP